MPHHAAGRRTSLIRASASSAASIEPKSDSTDTAMCESSPVSAASTFEDAVPVRMSFAPSSKVISVPARAVAARPSKRTTAESSRRKASSDKGIHSLKPWPAISEATSPDSTFASWCAAAWPYFAPDPRSHERTSKPRSLAVAAQRIGSRTMSASVNAALGD